MSEVCACLGCGSRPAMRRVEGEKYRAECSDRACRWNDGDGGFLTRQGAAVAWNRSNIPNDDWVLYHWWRRCLEIHNLPSVGVALSGAEVQQLNKLCQRNYGEMRYASQAA